MSLDIIGVALQRIAKQPNLDDVVLDCFRDVDGLRRQVSLMISEMNGILEDVLKRGQDTAGPVKPKVKKCAWLWKKKHIEKKRAQIKDKTASLSHLTLLLSSFRPWSVFDSHVMNASTLELQIEN
jgi:hypothetical protein